MSHRKLQWMRDTLICTVESELQDLSEVDTCELGEVIDMIKDLEEAIYYRTVTEAMTEQGYTEHQELKKNDHQQISVEGHMGWTVPRDEREGRSYNSRKAYIEAREMNKDKASQLRELEKYMQELSWDITEMIMGASPEEKQYLEKKITALASKIEQMK